MRILAADVGGTRARFAVVEAEGPELVPERRWELSTSEHASMENLLERVLDEADAGFEAACFGVAGPVTDNRVEITNLGWIVDGTALGRRFGLRLTLVNDLVATGLGLAELAPGDREELKAGAPGERRRQALLAAGTGIGMALLRQERDGWVVTPSEGGHVDFAPRSETEWELFRFLRARFGGRVSAERVVSGLGLRNLLDFFAAKGHEPLPEIVERLNGADDGRVIVEGARELGCPACRAAVEQFLSTYGAVAGNVALISAASAVLLAGGLTLGLRAELRGGEFLASFLDKGRMRPLLERIPVEVITRRDIAVLGAARCAMRSAGK